MQVHRRRLTQKDKKKIRNTDEWKELRCKLHKKTNTDYITGRVLEENCSCHHMNLKNKNYQDFSNPDEFMLLNAASHKIVHLLYNEYEKDESVLTRLKEVMDKMKTLSN